MKKFSSNKDEIVDKTQDESRVVYKNKYLTVVEFNNWSFIDEWDSVVVLPFFIDSNEFLLRSEYISPFKYRDSADFHLTCISGSVEPGESIEACAARELVEEAGIKLKDNVVFEVFDTLYKAKNTSSQFHFVFLPLYDYQYDDVVATTDGTKYEEVSKTIKLRVSSINSLSPADTSTRILIEYLKKYLNM